MEPSRTLTDVECRVLELLMQPNRSPSSSTTEALAQDAHLPPPDARRVLLDLERRHPALVRRPGSDAPTDDDFWMTTRDAADAWEADCRS
jgi:hypothetical protein